MPPTQEYPSPYKMDVPEPGPDLRRQAVGQHRAATTSSRTRASREVGPYAHEGGDREVGQHLLRAADQRHRHLPGDEDGRQDGRRRGPTASKLDQVPVDRPRHRRSISPLTMANAYATFANRGMYCTPGRHRVDHRRATARSSPGAEDRRARARCPRRPPTPSTPCCSGVVEDGTGQAGRPRPTATAPARPVRRTSATPPGSSATRRTCPARSGSASPRQKRQDDQHHHRRRATTTRSSAARSPARSGGTR